MSNHKVYCRNCKWFEDITRACNVLYAKNSPVTDAYLDHKGYRTITTKHIDLTDDVLLTPFLLSMICEFNKNYNCKYYKKSWWKFWVKDVKA